MWRSYGRDGDGDGAVAWVLSNGGATLCSTALLWFRGERKGGQSRARERVGVSGKEARGGADNECHLAASRAYCQPALAMRRPCSMAGWPCPSVARRLSVHDQASDSVISSDSIS